MSDDEERRTRELMLEHQDMSMRDEELWLAAREHLMCALAGPVEVEELQEVVEDPDGLQRKTVRKKTKHLPPQRWAFDLLMELRAERKREEQQLLSPDWGLTDE